MRDLIHRARTQFRQNPLLAGLGALVLLVTVAPLLIQLVFLLALLAIPVLAGIMIGWHLRADPARLAPFFHWRDRVLATLARGLEVLQRWVERQLDGFRAGQGTTKRSTVDPFRDDPQRPH